MYVIDNIHNYLYKKYIKRKVNIKYTNFYNYVVYGFAVLFWPVFLIFIRIK